MIYRKKMDSFSIIKDINWKLPAKNSIMWKLFTSFSRRFVLATYIFPLACFISLNSLELVANISGMDNAVYFRLKYFCYCMCTNLERSLQYCEYFELIKFWVLFCFFLNFIAYFHLVCQFPCWLYQIIHHRIATNHHRWLWPSKAFAMDEYCNAIKSATIETGQIPFHCIGLHRIASHRSGTMFE